ncbi:MAG: hydroxymethylglutaryl-CoA synthase [Candidatus Thermoplasmatota archaeon]|nr:hydroxymethylglutaryl-CoA synthase [Euryarchaeota archaeon]MBU4031782.1 hydroxymethylglutaryl-CoA synthase [Candidatus Thermoplasmatota archaeon]MBU4071697.1 hydroxymethylglutaryl-CoA synthase [Candidatus Thermoplasmatota archaeon]MBU4143776.1 hydroxymethylglutaryl-CoA synthase [Candidatus Thermoplasmatota archaeon]MBU4591390.1 hydroxymethylglutaryl-CoA synthase [Candidatus Thermoplasmatota archaeon]
MDKVGIVSYGGYVPHYRIEAGAIGAVWGIDGTARGKSLGIIRKSVPSPDEDVITISVEAARKAMRCCNTDPEDIGAVYVGSESHPYAVKPSATIVAEAIGAAPRMTAADLEFACKAGTAGIQICMGLVASDMIKYGMAIGADTSQGAPGDALEYSASAGGAAFLIGKKNLMAEINTTLSFTTDTPDFWRREGQLYPRHGGRFTGTPAYFKHINSCAQMLFEKMGTKPEDYAHAIFHQPNGKFPLRVGKAMGFSDGQLEHGLLTPVIGNTYSGAVPLALTNVLDHSEPGDRIFVISYGSGAGSDGFDITVTNRIKKLRKKGWKPLSEMVNDYQLLDYATYAKFRGKIRMGGIA